MTDQPLACPSEGAPIKVPPLADVAIQVRPSTQEPSVRPPTKNSSRKFPLPARL